MSTVVKNLDKNRDMTGPEDVGNVSYSSMSSTYSSKKSPEGLLETASFHTQVKSHQYWDSVKKIEGIWWNCYLCGIVTNIKGFTFNQRHWSEHLHSVGHIQKAKKHENLQKRNASAAEKYGLLSDKDIQDMKVMSRYQVGMSYFSNPKKKRI